MKSFIMIKGLFVILLATQAASQELTSTLHSTLYGVQIAYVDEMIVFTCVVRGSDNMAWTSEEYIGTGGQQLPFAAAEPEGSVQRAIGNDQTVATLVTAINTGDIMIVSELHIRITSTHPLASVQCISRGADIAMVNSTSFQLAAATSVTCDRQFLCPGETTVTCVCATANSSALAWTFNEIRLNFTSNNATLSRRDLPGSNGFVVLTENSVVNGIRVIMSNITVSASSSDVTLTCGNVDQNMIEPITVPTIETCPVSPSGTTPTGSDNSGDSTGPIIAAVVVPLILVILVIIAIPIVITLLKFQTRQKAEEIRSVNQRISERDTRIQALQKENEALKQTKALQEKQLTDIEDKLKGLQQKLGEKDGAIVKLKTEMRDKQAVKDAQKSKLDEKDGAIVKLKTEIKDKEAVIAKQISKLDEQTGTITKLETEIKDKKAVIATQASKLSQEQGKAAELEELKSKVISMKEEHTAALKLMEENMKKKQKDAFEALKETMKKAIKERTNGETSVDPKKGKGKTSKQTLEDEMEKGIDTTSSRLEKLLEEEVKTVLKDIKQEDSKPKETTHRLSIFGMSRT